MPLPFHDPQQLYLSRSHTERLSCSFTCRRKRISLCADLPRRAADAAVDALNRKALPPHIVLKKIENLLAHGVKTCALTCTKCVQTIRHCQYIQMHNNFFITKCFQQNPKLILLASVGQDEKKPPANYLDTN